MPWISQGFLNGPRHLALEHPPRVKPENLCVELRGRKQELNSIHWLFESEGFFEESHSLSLYLQCYHYPLLQLILCPPQPTGAKWVTSLGPWPSLFWTFWPHPPYTSFIPDLLWLLPSP